ncbi:MAG TPA: four helix bundle protein [Candidatus Hodarchaeales archaeon]|nr:four helix bundle protein [Candidatus Hodarchaeales archaeon]
MTELIAKHGGYKNLKSFQMAQVVYDLTVEFVEHYIDRKSRTRDQMTQAARSGKQNIAEASVTSGTSKKSELRLMDVARASLQELLEDYSDFLRQRNLKQWNKDDERAVAIRQLAYRIDRTDRTDRTDKTDKTNRTNRTDKSHRTYESYMSNAESAANCLICLINQTNYFLDRQLLSLEQELTERGDLSDRIKTVRKEQIAGLPNMEKFLRQQGFQRLEDGRVVKDEKERPDL